MNALASQVVVTIVYGALLQAAWVWTYDLFPIVVALCFAVSVTSIRFIRHITGIYKP